MFVTKYRTLSCTSTNFGVERLRSHPKTPKTHYPKQSTIICVFEEEIFVQGIPGDSDITTTQIKKFLFILLDVGGLISLSQPSDLRKSGPVLSSPKFPEYVLFGITLFVP